MVNKKIFIIIVMFALVSVLVSAVPPLPTEFYGKAQSFNNPVLPGSTIFAYDSDNNICGTFSVQKLGYFGVLTCRGEVSETNTTGGTENEVITFRINTLPASVLLSGTLESLGNVVWNEGTFKEVTIVAPPLVCGDGYCDLYESCSTCVADCGTCPVNPPSGGGGGEGGGGGSGGSGAGGAPQAPLTGYVVEGGLEEQICEESWSCADWGPCTPQNIQYKECIDLNACGTTESIPEMMQECIYDAGLALENVTDRNVTIREPPQLELPVLITPCTDKLPFFSLPSLMFILLVLLILSISFMRLRITLRRIRLDKELDELKKLELAYLVERKTYIFFIVITVISIIVYLYHYFFFLCKDYYVQHLWLLAAFVLMSPVIVHVIIESTKFSQGKKNRLVRMFNDTHYKHVRHMISIANEELIRAENSIVNNIYILENREEFHDFLLKNANIVRIYKDMAKLYSLYKRGKNPVNVEKDLLESIKKLDSDDAFQKSAAEHPELSMIKDGLRLLYAAYESKQGLYDELAKIQDEYAEAPVIEKVSENKENS